MDFNLPQPPAIAVGIPLDPLSAREHLNIVHLVTIGIVINKKKTSIINTYAVI